MQHVYTRLLRSDIVENRFFGAVKSYIIDLLLT
jgi:hypothetical protein